MPWQMVMVRAWVPARPPSGGGSPPYVDAGFPADQPYPDQGLPGNQPGMWPIRPPYIDAGLPGPQPPYPPYMDIGFPGNQPYPDQGLPGNQPIIWPGPRPPYIDAGLPGPQPPYPPYMDIRPPQTPGRPPTIWDPRPPYVDIGFPGPQPGGPVYPDQGLPGNQPYPDQTLPPIVDFEEMPDHPEVPDLNAGNWMYVVGKYATLVMAFVPWPLAVTHPDYHPHYPEQGAPGDWVAIVTRGRPVWAWIPSRDGDGGEGEQQKVAKATKATA